MSDVSIQVVAEITPMSRIRVWIAEGLIRIASWLLAGVNVRVR